MLKSILDEAKLLSNDPVNFIHEFFSDLKNEIDLKKEESVAKIEDEYEKIINEVLEVEKECKIKAKNKAIDLEKMVQEIDYTLKKWNESVNQLDFDSKDDEWKSIRFEAAKEIQKLEDEMDKFKDELFLNKKYSFQPSKNSKDDKYFGEFYAKNYEIGKISMVLNNFSSFEGEIDSNKTIIKDLGWIIKADFDDEDGYFLFSLFPKSVDDEDALNDEDDDDDDTDNDDLDTDDSDDKNDSDTDDTNDSDTDDSDNDDDDDDDDEDDYDYDDYDERIRKILSKKLEKNPVEAEFVFRIRPREARKSNLVNDYYKSDHIFDCSGGFAYGFGTDVTIMNPLNGLYNKDADSILMEATIKILS